MSFERCPYDNDFWPISSGDLNIVLGAWNGLPGNCPKSCDQLFFLNKDFWEYGFWSRDWITYLHVETHAWTCACVAKLTYSASCSWWWYCYMSKRTYEHVLLLPSRCLVHLAVDDNLVIRWNARMDICVWYQEDV